MDLRLLEMFCRVYQERSFSRAARALGLTQPTVSVHIRDFERSVGTPLFNRLGREIEPTQAGRFLYQHAHSILVLKRHLMEKMAHFLNRVEGDLLVGASSVPGEYLLPSIVAAFQARYPDVRARLRIGDTAATLEDLRTGDIELGVVGATAPDKDLVFEPFASDSLVLAAPAAKRWSGRTHVSIRELRELPLIVRETGSGTRAALERTLGGRDLTLADFRVSAELGSTTAIKQAVGQGYGVSFLSGLAIASDLAAGTLRALRVRRLGAIRRTYYTVVSRRRTLSPLTEAFLRYLESHRRAARPGRRARGGARRPRARR